MRCVKKAFALLASASLLASGVVTVDTARAAMAEAKRGGHRVNPADPKVSSIELDPGIPKAGRKFALNVDVSTEGRLATPLRAGRGSKLREKTERSDDALSSAKPS